MTLFFNINLLERKTNNDPKYIIIALYKLYKKKYLPKNSIEKYKPIRNLGSGTSFLLNPKALFSDTYTDIIYKAQYVRLAARRDYNLYLNYKFTQLDLVLYPDINIAAIKNNPLLNIKDNKIQFKYEDTNGN